MSIKARKTQKHGAPRVGDFQALLRSAGLRSTASRVAVLEYFHVHSGPNSHAELFDALGDRGFDRATIYRILIDLSDVGILSRTDLGDHVWRFERRKAKAGHSEAHPHFVCIDCGGVTCLPDLAVKVVAALGAPKALRTKQVEVQVKGRCDACA